MTANGIPVRGLSPELVLAMLQRCHSPCPSSARAWPRAIHAASTIAAQSTVVQDVVAALEEALTIVPGGAVTEIGRTDPAFNRMSGSIELKNAL
jgi:hypothetical protein